MAYPKITGDNPQKILEEGSKVLTLGDKHRVFTMRKVAYDDSIKPIYSCSISMKSVMIALARL